MVKIKIQCCCNATFEILYNGRHKFSTLTCNSCGRSLPDGSSEALKEMLEAYSRFSGAMSQKDLYEFSITDGV